MNIRLKLTAAALAVCATTACSNLPPAVGDWIEVPLPDNTWWDATVPYQESEYSIALASGEALEHKIAMEEGEMAVYAWTVEMDQPELLAVEFHGHTERLGEEPGTLMFYTIHSDGRESGTLKAPFSGIHGWYFNNTSEQDIEISLRVAGFFSDYENP